MDSVDERLRSDDSAPLILGVSAEIVLFATASASGWYGWFVELLAVGALGLAIAICVISGGQRALIVVVLAPLLFQNLLLGLWLVPGYDLGRTTTLLEAKTMVAVLVTLAGIGAARGQLARALPYLAPASMLAVWALMSLAWSEAGSLMTAVAYLRNFSTPVLFAALGVTLVQLDTAQQDLGRLVDIAIALGVGLTIFSTIELAFGSLVWRNDVLHIPLLELAKGPVSDATDFLGYFLPRLRSAVGEPVSASYIFATVTWMAAYRHRWLLAVLFGIQGVLTFGKGGMLVGSLALCWVLGARVLRSQRALGVKALLLASTSFGILSLYSALSGGPGAPTLIGLLASPQAYYSGHNSAFAHSGGLVLGFRSMLSNPLGAGLGVGGNFGNIFDAVDVRTWITTGAESAVGVVMYQLGMTGLGLVIALFAAALRHTFLLQHASNRLGTIMAGLTVGFAVASLFQENAFGPQAGGLFFVLLGATMMVSAPRRYVDRHAAE